MGRPWWYDSYWQQNKPPRRIRGPRGWVWIWIALAVVSLVLGMWGTGFRPLWAVWTVAFVSYFCRILSLAILVRAVLSWFPVNPRSRAPGLVRDTTEPVLAPLRRVIPLLGSLDITPIVAIILLNFVPTLVGSLVSLVS